MALLLCLVVLFGGVDVGSLAFLPPRLSALDQGWKGRNGLGGVLELGGEADAHGVVALGVEAEHAVRLGEDQELDELAHLHSR